MKRKLLNQIKTEWKSNMWLAVELLIVSVVVWFVTDNLWIKTDLRLRPMGVDTENCFKIDIAYVNFDSPMHEDQDSTDQTGMEHILSLYDRLRNHPGVEHVAIAQNGTPYELSFNGNSLITIDSPDTLMTTNNNMFTVSPEYLDVFRITGTDGESTARLKELLAKGEILLSNEMNVVSLTDMKSIDQQDPKAWQRITRKARRDEIVGHTMSFYGYDADAANFPKMHVGATITPIRRMEYEPATGNTIRAINITNPNTVCSSFFLVRVKPEAFATFRHDILKESDNHFRSGNRFVSNVTAISDIRTSTQSEEVAAIRNYVVLMVFLLVCIFLGLLGTFWFRTQQRVSEIAIRKVNGATEGDIFRRLISEGLMLLAIVTPLALLIDYGVGYFIAEMPYSDYELSPWRFAGSALLTFLLMSAMITLGIWLPASKAMRIDAASALKDE